MPDMPEVVMRIFPVVYNLCQRRELPVLVTDYIARYLDEQDLLTISTLSPMLHDQANAILYRDIVLDLSEERSRRTATLLLRTLLTAPTSIRNVRSLSLTGEPLYQWRKDAAQDQDGVEAPVHGRSPPEILADLAAFAPDELELYREMCSLRTTTDSFDMGVALPKLCSDIISLLSHGLEILKISSDYFRYHDFRDRLRIMFDAGRFTNLRHTSFCKDLVSGKLYRFVEDWRCYRHIRAVKGWDDTLLIPFSAPSINSITAVLTLDPEATSRLPVTSITRLVLHHCQTQEFDLHGLLASTPQLAFLEYHAAVDYTWYKKHWSLSGMRCKLGLDALFDALHHVSSTLTELITSQEFDEDSYHFHWQYVAGYDPGLPECNELSKLTHLHTLVVPFASLLGWRAKEHKTFDWHRILPRSLHQVTFTDNLEEVFLPDGWEEQDLIPVFADLGSFLGTCGHSDPPPRFTLRLFKMDAEFNEPIRQSLSRLFEESGVSCSVEKARKDRILRPPRMSLDWKLRLSARRGRGRGRGRGSG